jgi:NADH:ubiquinone oxidoreductase subunit 2 (subunit N)
MKKMFNQIISIVAILILICSIINIYIYYRDVKEIKTLEKEKLKLEIEILKRNNNE